MRIAEVKCCGSNVENVYRAVIVDVSPADRLEASVLGGVSISHVLLVGQESNLIPAAKCLTPTCRAGSAYVACSWAHESNAFPWPCAHIEAGCHWIPGGTGTERVWSQRNARVWGRAYSRLFK